MGNLNNNLEQSLERALKPITDWIDENQESIFKAALEGSPLPKIPNNVLKEASKSLALHNPKEVSQLSMLLRIQQNKTLKEVQKALDDEEKIQLRDEMTLRHFAWGLLLEYIQELSKWN